jgi:hypothetical protein
VVLEGQMQFFSPAGELEGSKLCLKFPRRILTSQERLDLEQQKEVSKKTNRIRRTFWRTPHKKAPEGQ